jgi:hypothetical protein
MPSSIYQPAAFAQPACGNVAANPDAAKEFGNLARGNLKTKVGPDLANLLKDAGFNGALRHGTFYKQHSDEPFQVLT